MTIVEQQRPGVSVSDARLDSVLDTAVDGIIVIDEQARILAFNKACERLFGLSAAEVIGRNVKVIMPHEYAGAHDRYVADYIRTGVRKIIGIGREVRGQHRDGTVFPVELSVGEALTPDGRQFIGILRDLRPRKEAEQRMSQLQGELLHLARVSAMDEMGSALAHELTQPLTALMLYLQTTMRAVNKLGSASEQISGILEKAINQAERAGSIIQRMRHFIEKRDPQRRLTDIAPLVDEAVELTLLGSPAGMHILKEFDSDLPKVMVDPVQIQQILVNLVRNAVEAVKRHPNPEIKLCGRRGRASVIVTVEDNGPGIPPDSVPNLFKAFSTSKRSGLGLGLAISRTIAQNHGGDLTVDPGGNGQGACFMLNVPAPDPDA